jgi:hypothetical protein
MFGKPTNFNLLPIVEKISFANTKLEKLERGDILYFGYSGTREDQVIDPCVIFSGYDRKTGLIQGVNMRNFYIDKCLPIANSVMNKYAQIYWEAAPNEQENEEEETSPEYQRAKVGYASPQSFLYETLDLYKMALIHRVIKGKREQINLMRQYWRSYQPIKMRLLGDTFSKLANNNISVNLTVANVIINAPPTKLTVQPKIEG